MRPPPPRNAHPRHTSSLAAELEHGSNGSGLLRNKARKRKSLSDDPDAEGDAGTANGHYVDAQASRKILKIGRELAELDEAEAAEQRRGEVRRSAWEMESRGADVGARAESTEEGDNEGEDGVLGAYDDDDGLDEWGDEEEVEQVDEEIDPSDLALFHRFMPPSGEEPTLDLGAAAAAPPEQERKGTNLADLILREIAAHEARQARAERVADGVAVAEEEEPEEEEVPQKVIEVYSKVGMILSRYKSGKLPKPFKILPSLGQWETLLEITRPDNWTPNAVYEATRIFVNAKPGIVQRFLELVMLDRVRSEIYETKKLNVHLFQALKRATYKPAGFFKGFLFPLVQSGTCTLREAHVVAGVLTRVSIPVLHSAAALLRLTDIAAEQASVSTESGGATNIFIRVLLDKKYALPYKVVDNLVFHFLRFRAFDTSAAADSHQDSTMHDARDPREWKLPVLWHQSLLAFAQRYRNDITEDQREALLDLLLVRWHPAIGPEVRRELIAGRGRGVPVPADNGAGVEADDTMVMEP